MIVAIAQAQPLAETHRRAWWFACLVALALRLLIMVYTAGTNDIHTWQVFAQSIDAQGLLETYRTNLEFNHPPLMGLWTWLCWKLAPDPSWFPFLFKLLALAGDALAATLLYRFAPARRAALPLAALFLWNPVSILVTAYHGNTDPLLAALCLWAALLTRQRQHGRAGLALGAAFNVKVLALVLVAPLFVSARGRAALLRFGAGFALACLPFAVPLLGMRQAFVAHVFGYNSTPGVWGFSWLFGDLSEIRHVGPSFAAWQAPFLASARHVILALTAAAGLWTRLRAGERWLEVGAFGLCLALVFAPGFGYQYLAWPLPLLFAINARRAVLTSLAGGALLAAMYVHYWSGEMPAMSWTSTWPRFGVVAGVVVWLNLAGWVWYLGEAIIAVDAETKRERWPLESG